MNWVYLGCRKLMLHQNTAPLLREFSHLREDVVAQISQIVSVSCYLGKLTLFVHRVCNVSADYAITMDIFPHQDLSHDGKYLRSQP